jgi:indole-3-glycerol phosphate synthase
MIVEFIKRFGQIRVGEKRDLPEKNAEHIVKLGFAKKLEKTVYENKAEKLTYEVKQASPGWFDVLKDGEPVNTKKLRKAEAEELINNL